MTRLSRLQENSIIERLKQARLDFDTLKNSQRAGSDSVLIRRVATGNTVDFTTTTGYHDLRIWELTITPSDPTFPNSSYIWHIFWVLVSQTGTGTLDSVTEILAPDANGVRKARLYVMNIVPSASLTLNIRYVIYAIGNLDVSIAQIA